MLKYALTLILILSLSNMKAMRLEPGLDCCARPSIGNLDTLIIPEQRKTQKEKDECLKKCNAKWLLTQSMVEQCKKKCE